MVRSWNPWNLVVGCLLLFAVSCCGLSAQAEPMTDVASGVPDGSGSCGVEASGTWVWEVDLRPTEEGRHPVSKSLPDIPASFGTVLSWHPEIDVSGRHLGWDLVLGDIDGNRLIDPAIPHGPQPFEFYGWQFQPVREGLLGLRREWCLREGTLRVFVLDYSLSGTSLVQLTARCEWIPRSIGNR